MAVRPGCTIEVLPNGCTVTHSWLAAGGVGDLDGVGDFVGVGDLDGVGDVEGVGDDEGVGDLVGTGVRDGLVLGVGVAVSLVLGVGSLVVPVGLGSGVAGGVSPGELAVGEGLVALTVGDVVGLASRAAASTAAAGR